MFAGTDSSSSAARPAPLNRLSLPDGWTATLVLSASRHRSPCGGELSRECQRAGQTPDEMSAGPNADEWRAFLTTLLRDPTRLDGYEVLKVSPAGEVFRARLSTSSGTQEVIVRQRRPDGSLRRVMARLRPSHERRSFSRALALHAAGIGTAAPLALLERSRGADRAWLITEYLPGVADLEQVLIQLNPAASSTMEMGSSRSNEVRISQPSAAHPASTEGIARDANDIPAPVAPTPAASTHRRRCAVLDAVADLLVTLHRGGWRHRDFKASNVLLRGWDGADPAGVRTFLVDLDGLHRRRIPCLTDLVQAVVRLSASLHGVPGMHRTDFARLLRACARSTGGDESTWRPWFRRLARRSERYRHKAQRRKRHKLDGYMGLW